MYLQSYFCPVHWENGYILACLKYFASLITAKGSYLQYMNWANKSKLVQAPGRDQILLSSIIWTAIVSSSFSS